MQRYLTTSQKDKERPYHLHRQHGKCLFCGEAFVTNPANDSMNPTYEHLDGNVFHNDRDNHALVHKRCNNDKKWNSDYQIIAQEQLKQNRISLDSLSESETTAPKPASKEIDLNVAMKKLTYEYLQERLIRQGKPAINYNDAAHSISYIFWERTGHGSSETVKRHLNDFTSSAAPFKTTEENGETVILKRS